MIGSAFSNLFHLIRSYLFVTFIICDDD